MSNPHQDQSYIFTNNSNLASTLAALASWMPLPRCITVLSPSKMAPWRPVPHHTLIQIPEPALGARTRQTHDV